MLSSERPNDTDNDKDRTMARPPGDCAARRVRSLAGSAPPAEAASPPGSVRVAHRGQAASLWVRPRRQGHGAPLPRGRVQDAALRNKYSVPKTHRYPKITSGIAVVAIVPYACGIEMAANTSSVVYLMMNGNVEKIAD